MVNKKKSPDNWGRPRKQLIEGVKEVSLTVQLPETLIKALRKEGKKQGKSMKELIGTSLLSSYAELLNIPQGDNNLVELEKSNENNLNSRLKKILFKMKRIFIMMIAMTISFASFAQNKDVTKFLGIPVDGTKTEMKQKLIAKGFVPKKIGDIELLEGEFNGHDVHVYIVTNKNKVYRIMLCDKNLVNEAQIKIRFNSLVEQFKNNKRYFAFGDYSLSDEEDISHEMLVNNKIYAAFYSQDPDFENIDAKIQIEIKKKYSDEELKNPSETIKNDIEDIANKIIFMKQVCFRIQRYYNGEYGICMYYDNKYNQANGEDL